MSDYKIVPLEPTEEMLDSADNYIGYDEKRFDGPDIWRSVGRDVIAEGYRAAIAASPPSDQVMVSRADFDAIKKHVATVHRAAYMNDDMGRVVVGQTDAARELHAILARLTAALDVQS